MIKHPLKYVEKLNANDLDRILKSSFGILENTGLFIQSGKACDFLDRAGASVDFQTQHVRFSKKMIDEYLSQTPSEWTLHARNPEKNVQIGNRSLVVAPGYGSAFIADISGKRRSAVMKDFENMALLSFGCDAIDITGGVLVEPEDIATQLRPIEITRALIMNSDKPFMGSVAGKNGAARSIEMARIVFGDIENKPCVLGLININSPLRLDNMMAEAMIEYVSAAQPVLLTPGILMGMTSPVTVAGALAQSFAELLACVVLAQTIRPGSLVIIGLGGFGSDLRNGSTGFGRPENALATELGAQIARYLKIPFRCSAVVTGSRRPDCRSGYERMMTALTAYYAGAHFCLQAAGILDSINSMSYEQYLIDMEIWSYIKRLSKHISVDDETLALGMAGSDSSLYMSSEHTIRHMREEILEPLLVKPDTYEQWLDTDAKDVVSQAHDEAGRLLRSLKPPELDNTISLELQKYVAACRKKLDQIV